MAHAQPIGSSSPTRIFISDLQRFNMVQIGPETSAKDVLDAVEKQGELTGEEHKPGGWMVWEVSQDFGMERPIRNYEHLADIAAAWNKEKMMNMFMIKKCAISSTLASMPTSSPKCGGYVEWESKKGKWSKRWLELREHSLWISKREGKAEDCLCSLSVFDAYQVTRIHRAPKPFVFAVKSTEPISLFENTSDYVHVFSCSEEHGQLWLESIMLARSYVMYQEKHILFKDKNLTGGSALARAGTRKQSRPSQPLVNVTPPYNPGAAPPGQTSFEPGSLLAKRLAEGTA
ncbi:hypothetical protein BD410DRAFT_814591 [Rickenella mellea]|uniref:PH domain-containing protein n=1 Tax=Rickenella mellea TaxID=50990 RepID=A0A4Y7Q7R0_9AGAM|nr:hypothetical protein BD410DRAFT_814591 [Rickenella mellea]